MRRRLRLTLALGVAPTILVTCWWTLLGQAPSYGDPARVEVRPDTGAGGAYRLAVLSITTTTGRTVECVLRTPVAATGRLPAVLLSGGINTGRRAATLVDSAWAGIVLSCDYPWADPTRHPVRDLLALLPRTRAEILASPQVLRVAAQVLAARPDVDTDRIAGIGASLGVPFVAAWAADDGAAHAVALVYGGGDLRLLLAANLRRHIAVGAVREGLAWVGAALLRPLDPVRTVGRIAPRPLLIVAATDDQRIPPEAVGAMAAAARPPVTVRWIAGRHLHPSDTELLRVLTDTTMAWLRSALP